MNFNFNDIRESLKEFNAELRQYQKTFGNGSRVSNDLMLGLEQIVGKENVYTNARTGALQFRNTRAARAKIENVQWQDAELLNEWLKNQPKYGEYIDKLREKYQNETGERGTLRDLANYQEQIDLVRQASEDGTLSSILSEQARQGKDTRNLGYAELAKLVREYQEQRNQETQTANAVRRVNVDKKPKIERARGGGMKHAGVSIKHI